MAATLRVQDVKTREIFEVSPVADRVVIVTKDGVRVRLHPSVMQYMVKDQSNFDGHTVTGTRPMRKL